MTAARNTSVTRSFAGSPFLCLLSLGEQRKYESITQKKLNAHRALSKVEINSVELTVLVPSFLTAMPAA